MSGGRKITDHSTWIGSGSESSVLPMGTKSKMMSNAEGAGELSHYEDTAETIKSQQEMNISKMKSQTMPAGRRH
jgi:hypothetical protein